MEQSYMPPKLSEEQQELLKELQDRAEVRGPGRIEQGIFMSVHQSKRDLQPYEDLVELGLAHRERAQVDNPNGTQMAGWRYRLK
jgi:hypothetical protein